MKAFFSRVFFKFKLVFQMETCQSSAALTSDNFLLVVDLNPGDIAIDCGANVGDITAKMAHTGATVYAFEPNPYAFHVLSERFSSVPNVHCINKGVLDRDGKMTLFLHERAHEDQVHWSVGSSLLDFKGNVDAEAFVEVEVIDLAQFIEDMNLEIKVVKMDVEGVEYQIIHYLIDTGIIKKIKHLLVETHEEKIPRLRQVAQTLRERIDREGITNINLEWI